MERKRGKKKKRMFNPDSKAGDEIDERVEGDERRLHLKKHPCHCEINLTPSLNHSVLSFPFLTLCFHLSSCGN